MEFSILLVGLIFGSFLNMLIYRLPLGISLINPKLSICTSCKTTIKIYENIPIVSYIFLKGKCSHCGEKISIVYPIVEVITAIVTLLLFYRLGLNLDFIITTLLFYTIITLSFIDFRYKAVPDYLLIIAMIFAYFSFGFSLSNALLFAGGAVLLEFFVTFYIQNIKSRLLKDESLEEQKAMGEGDIPIFAIIGGLLGVQLGMIAIFFSAILAIIPSILNRIIKKDIETAFIPFLGLALFIIFICDDCILDFMKRILI